MIIKFQEGNGRWIIFGEIDHLEYEEIQEEGVVGDGVLVYLPTTSPAKVCLSEADYLCSQRKIAISFFTKNMTEATVIHAYSPIYLMNDQGRTVETI